MLLEEERKFYEKYQWALMPFLSFEQIRETLDALVNEDIASMPPWCRQEWNINLYLLSSAAADSADDYLARGVYNFSKLADYMSLLHRPVKLVRELSISTSRVRGHLRDKELRRWRERWSEWLISLCHPLVTERIPQVDEQRRFRDAVAPLLTFPFPNDLRRVRARIPAAYRSQDLSHCDFVSLTRKYSVRHSDRGRPYMIVGLRSAGSYIAPLVCARLKSEGYADVSYLTIRPKSVVHPWDEERLKNVARRNASIILVDEPPGTGKTIARSVEIMKQFGVNSESITIMVPIHPANREWLDYSLKSSFSNADIVSLEPEEWHKAKLLSPESVCESLRSYFKALGVQDIEIKETAYATQKNEELKQNPDKAFHVRLKKIFYVTPRDSRSEEGFIVMAKSVGWGWLGYHAALIASRLSEFIPRVYGVRDGIMYLEWLQADGITGKQSENQDDISGRLAAYISQRTNLMRLGENPTSFLSTYRDGGLQSIAVILSNAFGTKVSKLKRGWVRRQLERLACPVPTLLDSRMMKKEWVNSAGGLLKTDFEHHGFSKTASHNIVDPAYDIAWAMLEFELSDSERRNLVGTYIRKTADESVRKRLIYYTLLSGNESMNESMQKLNMIEHYTQYQELNRTYIRSWNFMVTEASHYSASFCEGQAVKRWGTPMFVMDIDDVLDKNIFGFPSTTANGIRALSVLRAHNVCSIINTARSLEEVKDYCKHFGFAGGIAEYGSVIWDDVDKKVEILVTPSALEELTAIRSALREIPGVFVNPLYENSIRAYCFDGRRTVPVPQATIGELFSKLGIQEVTAKRSYIDTALTARSVDKGKALLRVKNLKQLNGGRVGAIGDTEADLPMLIASDKGFLVANSTVELKRKARLFGISVASSSFQSGLLECVNRFLHGDGKPCERCNSVLVRMENHSDPFWQILNIADLPPFRHLLRLFDKDILKTFQE